MPIIDANVILRYLLKDHHAMSEAAKETILAGAQTTAEVLAEVTPWHEEIQRNCS